MLGCYRLKYLFRTSMMNCTKGVDLFKIQNQMVELYTPFRSYGYLEIFNRNQYFLRAVPLHHQTEAVQEKQLEKEEQTIQIDYKNSNKSKKTDEIVAQKNQEILQRQRLQNQTLSQFLKESIHNTQKKHVLFYLMVLSTIFGFIRAYIDLTHPKTVPQRARSITTTQSYMFSLHYFSAGMDLMDAKINKYDQRFWKQIQDIKKSNDQ